MLSFPNAKINLGLFIAEKRADGYHNLETVFYPVAVTDVLEAVPDKASGLTLYGKAVAGAQENNLVRKAFQLLQNDFGEHVKPMQWHLYKHIPMGAGLGGGSADGAAALKLINELCSLHLDEATLETYALRLGSDCPFFIRNRPAFASGRGELLEPLALDLSAYAIQLICPQVHVSTAAAFQMLQPKPAPFDLRLLPLLPVAEWRNHLANDFEQPVFAMHPQLRAIKDRLHEAGALYASMSGSGSAVFGIFEKGKHAANDFGDAEVFCV